MSSTIFTQHRAFRRKLIAVAAMSSLYAVTPHAAAQADADLQQLEEVVVTATAEEQLRQSLGVSVITEEDLERRPPANDLAEILITQPGVSLSGASSTGAYGNQREIDLRGMGAENTMILVDGRPVQTRQGATQRRTGDRDTGGDTNWVPADQIERIEVIRGPAAARYGSGASGGVINIITKRPTDKFSGAVTTYLSKPEDSGEGNGTRRLGFNLSGPVAENLSFRLYGSATKTDGNKPYVNGVNEDGTPYYYAGIEGRRNRDVNGLVRWDLTPDQVLEFQAGFSRQGNIYAGEAPTTEPSDIMKEWAGAGAETRRVYRQNASITHRGHWGALGDSRVVLQYENSRTHNCKQGPGRMNDGNCSNAEDTQFSDMSNYFLNGELNTPLTLGGFDQMLTTGVEWRKQDLRDSNPVVTTTGASTDRIREYADMNSDSLAVYLEDNIAMGDAFMLTPGIRLDHHSQFGNNWSPSVNALYELGGGFTLKGGIARAFKAPTPYQTSEHYASSLGGSCPYNGTDLVSGVDYDCTVKGNPDLKPEISLNKEIGVAWDSQTGWYSSIAYFRNDYKNRIVAESTGYDETGEIFQWDNAGKAMVHGLEGSFNVPLLGHNGNQLKLINNLTWMFSNKRKDTDQPLSIIPQYTLNSVLDWRANAQFSLQVNNTLYGRRKPRTMTFQGLPVEGDGLRERGSYYLLGVSASYAFNDNHRLNVGVSNLLDRQIKRAQRTSGGAGALTYNEPGRAYFVSYTASF